VGSTVVQGLSDLITSSELQVTDGNNTPAQLIYAVTTAPVYGQLELATAPGVAITSFTQADIDAGRLVYVNSGAVSTTDRFTFTVSDGAGGTIGATTFTFTVTPFSPPPVWVQGGGNSDGSRGVGATDDLRRAAMLGRKFARVVQPDIVLDGPLVLPLELPWDKVNLPEATADTYAATEDTVLTVPALTGVLANDTGLGDRGLTLSVVGPVTGGAVVLNNDGSFSFTPSENFTGVASFIYQVEDEDGDVSSARVTINVA
jgi:hypothetical protein